MIFRLAARNLSRNRRRSLLTIAAITFGLTMMILTITLQTGSYHEMMTRGISTLAGHVVVEHPDYHEEADAQFVVPHANERVAEIKARLPDAIIAPRIEIGGLMSSPTNSVGVGVRGVDPSAAAALLELDDQLVQGEWLTQADDNGVLIGAQLAEQLRVDVGEKLVFLYQGRGVEVESKLFRVRGVFETGSAEQDAFVVITTLQAVQALLPDHDSVHQITIHLQNPQTADAVVRTLRLSLPPDIRVMPWYEALPDLVAVINIDQASSDVMMAVIGCIVAMGVLNTLLMSVMERTREFGVLIAIGMHPNRLTQLILTEGFVLGLVATSLGVLFGVALSVPMVVYGIDMSSFAGESMETQGVVLPTIIHGAWNTPRVALYSAGSILITVLSALYPAYYIRGLPPVEAMHHT